ncbi:MAG: YfhO family protein [Bacteroidia bacterium]|nr:YfhO family protein [Bacteroidia bacterium]HQU99750.1 YfhO family protein [Bacteroidia bacterium]
MFQGKTLSQHDIAQWEGAAKEIIDFRNTEHAEPLWTNRMFGGMPAYQISTLYPSNLIAHVNTFLTFGLPSPAYLIFMGLLSFYILMLTLKVDYRLAIGGAISYAFVSFNVVVIQAGHNSEAHAIVLFPLVIAGVLMVFNKNYWAGGALTAIGLALQLYANHLQITYYTALTVLCLVIARSIYAITKNETKHLLKSALVLSIAATLGVLPNITNLLVTNEYGKASTRGSSELTEKKSSTGLDKDYALNWSNGKRDAVTLLIPDATGGASTKKLDHKSATYKALESNGVLDQAAGLLDAAPVYWGGLPSTSGPVYAGAIIILLCVIGMLTLKGPDKWWLLIATLLSVSLSWGRYFLPLTDLFFNYFPAYNKFRSVSMIMVIASFCLPLLAIMGLQGFIKLTDASERKKILMRALSFTGGFCVIVLLGSYMIDYSAESDKYYANAPWLIAALKQDRAAILRADTLRSLTFVLLAFGLLWFYINQKLKLHLLYMLLSVLFLFDMWPVAKRYLNNDSFAEKTAEETPFTPTQADMQILQDKSLGYRVMNTTVSTFNDAGTSYFHNSIGGYHGAKLKRYQELIEYQIGKGNQAVIDMLNTKYFIFQNKQSGLPEAQINPQACGNAWFVSNIKFVVNADAEMAALDKFNPKTEVFVDQRFKSQVGSIPNQTDSSASIVLTSYKPNYISYSSQTNTEQFAVLSEIYYDKGWNVYVDGKPTDYVRCNYVLRGMKVPAGNHKIEFKFEPATYAMGEKISLAGSLLLFAGCLAVLFMEFKKTKQSPETLPAGKKGKN